MTKRGKHRHLRPRKQSATPTREEQIEAFLTRPRCASCSLEEVSRDGLLCVECNEWIQACEESNY